MRTKRALALLLCALLTLLPASVLADTATPTDIATPTDAVQTQDVTVQDTYEIWVGGVQVTDGNASNILGNNTASYAPSTKTLTLTGANITTADTIFHGGIYVSGEPLNIQLVGSNTIDLSALAQATANSYGISVNGVLTITGPGTLTVTGRSAGDTSCGIRSFSGGIIIDNCTVTATGGAGANSYGAAIGQDGDITVRNGGSLEGIGGTATGDSHGVFSYGGNITVSSGAMTGRGDDEGISCGGYNVRLESGSISGYGGTGIIGRNITVLDGTMTGIGTNIGIHANSGQSGVNLTVSGGALIGNGTNAGISVNRSTSVTGGSVTGTGGNSGLYIDGSLLVSNAASVTGTGVQYGVRSYNGITVQDSANLSGTGGDNNSNDSYGVMSGPAAFIVTGGTVTGVGGAGANSYGLHGGSIALASGKIISIGNTQAINTQPTFTYATQTNANWYMWKQNTAASAPAGDYQISDAAHQFVNSGSLKYVELTTLEPIITVVPPLPNGTVGRAYRAQLTAAGMEPMTWSWSGTLLAVTGLPDGLSLDAATGVISGRPTMAGTYDFTVTATNGFGSDSKQVSVTIGTRPPVPPAPSPYDNPATGDAADIALCVIAAILAAGALVAVLRERRRES